MDKLHRMFQAAMGWEDSHLHCFNVGGSRFGMHFGEYPDDEKRDQYATEIRDLATNLKTTNVVFGLAPAKSKANTTWGIGETDEVTVIVYHRLRVKNRWTFKAADGPTDDQVKEIIAAAEETITGEKKK